MKKLRPIQQHIENEADKLPLLPLTHITTLHGFRAVSSGNKLVPTRCNYFDKDLLYLFYGRPSYRATQEASSTLLWNAPVGFIINPRTIKKIHRIFPFDTGAFKSGRYGRIFAPNSELDDFELEKEWQSVTKYVLKFFGDNERYMLGRSSVNQDVGNFDFEIQGIEYLSRLGGLQLSNRTNSVDERASALEIQLNEAVGLDQSIMAIIVPEDILNEERFLTAIKRWNVQHDKIIPYSNVLGPGSEAWVGQFFEKVLKYYKENGLI